jgi:hypothetical protein
MTCQQQLRMLHLRQSDLSEILSGLDLADNGKLEYRQFFARTPPTEDEISSSRQERLIEKVRFGLYCSVQMP